MNASGNSVGAWLLARLELGRVMGAASMRPMEGLRGVGGAAGVSGALRHPCVALGAQAGGSERLLEQVHAIGNVGVDLFFVLSGYLIYGSLLVAPRPFMDYLARRVRRIYPAFLAVFALYLVLALASGRVERFPTEPAAAALYVLQNLLLLPGVFPIDPLITVAWSLSYEFFFYLLVPLVVAGGACARAAAPGASASCCWPRSPCCWLLRPTEGRCA